MIRWGHSKNTRFNISFDDYISGALALGICAVDQAGVAVNELAYIDNISFAIEPPAEME